MHEETHEHVFGCSKLRAAGPVTATELELRIVAWDCGRCELTRCQTLIMRLLWELQVNLISLQVTNYEYGSP